MEVVLSFFVGYYEAGVYVDGLPRRLRERKEEERGGGSGLGRNSERNRSVREGGSGSDRANEEGSEQGNSAYFPQSCWL